MNRCSALLRSTRAAAAAEMALVTPLLLILMMGSFELGNFFMNEHKLVKAVRDGARFAGRQAFSSYTCPSTIDSATETKTKNVIRTGLIAGGNSRIVNWTDAHITLALTCPTTANSTTLTGIYKNAAGGNNGIPIVTVSATVPYTPVMASYGFRGVGLNLNATQQSAVMGL